VAPAPHSEAPSAPVLEGAPVRSRLAGNRRLRPAVRKFAGRLAEQMIEFERALSAGDFAGLAQLGHWLKGAGGTVGYDEFTEPASRLEEGAKENALGEVAAAMVELRSLAARLEVPEEEPALAAAT
jgi:HPt (histidine-containing phosphotransfer) domain-containing protein